MRSPYYQSGEATLYEGDCIEVLSEFAESSVDMMFADPPYNLSNDGITCHAGRMVSVNKGAWDKSNGVEVDHAFAVDWLTACHRVLKKDGTLWVSGTMHSIYSIGFAMQQVGYRLLNEIAWYKPNASPNLSCRYFTHSHESVIWAAKDSKSKHRFDYKLMKQLAGGKQMRSLWVDIPNGDPPDIWTISTPAKGEKRHGKHPTQKPIQLLERIVLASTGVGDIVLDPFTGSSTTGIAAIRHGRSFIGIDSSRDYLELSAKRLESELEGLSISRQLV